MANLPALPDASVWGLLKLKAGNKSKQAKKLERIQKESIPLETPDVIKSTRNKRRLQYNLTRQQLDLWKGPVHQNRLADQLWQKATCSALTDPATSLCDNALPAPLLLSSAYRSLTPHQNSLRPRLISQ
nr:unnamed protein product [Spirometra erinaceieuropaei]